MLQATYQGSATLYAILRRIADAKVFNNTNGQLETWSDADITQYAVFLSDRGGDMYQGNIPGSLPTDEYWIQYYVQSDSSPAISDLIIGKTHATWNGSLIPSTGSLLPSPYALTTLASIKRHLRLYDSSQDDLLIQLINQASAMIERWCNRVFLARDVVERYTLNSQRVLNLRQFPVQRINRVAWGYANCLMVHYAGDATRATIQATDDRVILSTTSSLGTFVRLDLTYADYPTTQLLFDAINAQAGWFAIADANVPSIEIHPVAGVNASGPGYSLTYPDYDTIEYTPDFSTGQISLRATFWNAWFASSAGHEAGNDCGPSMALNLRMGRGRKILCVDYRGGYETVPEDVALITNQVIQDAYYRSRIDPTKRSESLGDYSYSLADHGVMPLLSAQHQSALAPYKDIAVGGAV